MSRTVRGHLIDAVTGAIIVPDGIQFADGSVQKTAAQTLVTADYTFPDFPVSVKLLVLQTGTNLQTVVPTPPTDPDFSLPPGKYLMQASLTLGGASVANFPQAAATIVSTLQLGDAAGIAPAILITMSGSVTSGQGLDTYTLTFDKEIETTDTYDRMEANNKYFGSGDPSANPQPTLESKITGIKFYKLN